MKLTLKIATSVLIIAGIIMIILGATNTVTQGYGKVTSVITEYIAVGVLMLALGLAGFIACTAIGQPIELDTKNADEKIKEDKTNE